MTRTPARAGVGALTLAVAAVLGLGLSACDTVPAQAATVNGSDISRADLQRDLKALSENPTLYNLTGATNRSISGDAARSWLTQLITWELAEQIVAEHHLQPSSDAKAQVTEQLKSGPASVLPQDMKDEVMAGALAIDALSSTLPLSADELAKVYAVDSASTGALCVSHILLKTEAEAEAVRTELAGGAAFADVAKARSTEPAAKTSGGALTSDDGNACIPFTTFVSQFDADFTAGAVAGKAGVPSEPVKSQFGWHVILNRPYDEISADLAKLANASAGELALGAALHTADVSVDPRYGRWSDTLGKVVSLG